MPSRTFTAPPPAKKSAIQPPTAAPEWQSLLRRAIERAEARKDPRVSILQAALGSSDAESTLRRMGIVHDVDVAREFP